MVEAIVEYSYKAQERDELTIEKGEIITNINMKPGGWWEGTLRNRRGMFPDNFVKVIEKDTVKLRNKNSKVRQCRAVFSYHPAHDDELSLSVGDVIDVLGEVEEGWWRGRLGSNEGVFPCNFVVEIDDDKQHLKSSSREDLSNDPSENDGNIPNLPPKPTKVVCQAKYPYDACNDDELTLREGDLITLISKTGQDKGWWRGELRGQVGVFPDNFVVILSKLPDELQVKQDKGSDKSPSSKISLSPQTQADDSHRPLTVASQRRSLELKTEDRSVPPVPGKKPSIPKKSPSVGNPGALAELRQKLADMVDGAASSRISNNSQIKQEDGECEFDQIERSAMLSDMRATRAKKPAGRRPPSVIYRDNESTLVNGNCDTQQTTSNMSETSNDEEENEKKPKMREWEKHKVPWVEELKLNQAKRTTPPLTPASVDHAKLKLTPTDKSISPTDQEISDTKSKSPEMQEKVSSLVEMSKSTSSVPPKGKMAVDANHVVMRTKAIINQPTTTTPVRPQSIHGVMTSLESGKISPNNTNNQSQSSVTKPPIAEKNIDPKVVTSSPRTSFDKKVETVSLKNYMELLEKVTNIESKMHQQHQELQAIIAELKMKLQTETDMRKLLQAELEKVAQCVTQV